MIKQLKSSRQGKDNTSKLRRVQAMGQVLRDPTLQLPLLVNELLHMRAGYQSGCLVLQCTCPVFFRLHLCAAQMWWQFVVCGCQQWERGHLLDRILVGRRASLQPPPIGWMFRCRCVWFAPAAWGRAWCNVLALAILIVLGYMFGRRRSMSRSICVVLLWIRPHQ